MSLGTQDLQCAWLLLGHCFHCASPRANCQILAVCPAAVDYDENIWQCLWRILHIALAQCSNEVKESATLALILGRREGRRRRREEWASEVPFERDTPSGCRPMARPTQKSPRHTHLESCQRLSPPGDRSPGVCPNLLEGVGARGKTRDARPRSV